MSELQSAQECACNGNGCPSCDGSAERSYVEHERRAGRLASGLTEFQQRVNAFVVHCFGCEDAADIASRRARFLEEALEFVQALGATESDVRALAAHVFNRPTGERFAEAGGVTVTFAAACTAAGVDAGEAAATELSRIWGMIDRLRAKHTRRPANSPLPGNLEAGALTTERYIAGACPRFKVDCAGCEDTSAYSSATTYADAKGRLEGMGWEEDENGYWWCSACNGKDAEW